MWIIHSRRQKPEAEMEIPTWGFVTEQSQAATQTGQCSVELFVMSQWEHRETPKETYKGIHAITGRCHKGRHCQPTHNSDKLEIIISKYSWLEFADS